MSSNTQHYTTPEQLAYATVLDWGMKIGFIGLVITFVIYLSGIIPPHIPLEQLPQYWVMPVGEYLKAANVHTGWSWMSLIHRSDFMNFLGIAFLSGVTIVCYLRILLPLLRNKDRAYFIMALLEIGVLVLAASGILVIGH